MKRPKASLFDDELEAMPERLSYMDGFRFGLGFLVALVIGSGLVAAIVYGVARLFRL